MKKRILCVMLTLIMLVSLIPAGAISASAASLKVSEAAITVLKKMTSFQKECYEVADTQQWRTGYGTVCTKKGNHSEHTITEKQADTALRGVLAEVDTKVNSFASSNKLSLKQNQHDALVVFTYSVGSAWMSGNGVVKTAIVNGAGANELLSAMATVGDDMNRRKIEVNMYINGVYSNVVPSTFSTVTYDANGGQMAQGFRYDMYFDTAKTVAHVPHPVRTGYTFLGWYLEGELKNMLTADCAGKVLKALWQENGLQPKDAWKGAVDVSYTMSKSSLASTKVFSRPDSSNDYRLEAAKINEDTVTVYKDYIAPDGGRWSLIDIFAEDAEGNVGSLKAWVMVKAGSNGLPSGGNGGTEVDVIVTVTNDFVNSRKNATIFSAKNGTYYRGAKLRIINTASADGYVWGQIAKSEEDNTPIGWVALMYTNWNSVKDQGGSGSAGSTNAIARATITYNGFVNLRSAAGTDNKIVGALAKNETVDVYEIVTVNGHQWGRTNGGWFCLTYADVTVLGGSKNEDQIISNEGALSYVFPGLLTSEETPRVSPSSSAEFVEATYEFKNSKKETVVVDILPDAHEAINIYNMTIKNGETWVKISWRVDLDDNGKDDTTKYGWVLMDSTSQNYEGKNATISISSHPVQMYPVNFTVAANEVTVRTEPDSGASALSIKLNKGVQIQVNAIKLVGENIWGYLTRENVVTGESKYEEFDGWVNLASKYVSRTDVPKLEGDTSLTPIGKTATIINTDSVNVRITGSTSGKKIGSLSRGTTANILEISKNGEWYNLDVDVDKNPETGSWVHKDYLEIKDGYVGGSNGSSNGNNSSAPVTTGTGVVANTYAGVNVRSGAGTGYAAVGKLLPGTVVEILEMKQAGAAKWARIAQGWVCMDYITMLSQETTYPGGATDPDKGTNVGSYEELEKTSTTAVYTGRIKDTTPIYSETIHWEPVMLLGETSTVAGDKFVRMAQPGDSVIIYELMKVTEKIKENDSSENGHGTVVEKTVTSFWARTNDGYIFNPQDYIELDALDEKVHTYPGEKLNVRDSANGNKIGKLEQGDQVKVTALEIVDDKVWGRIDFEGEEGWIRLDMMVEGAYYVDEKKDDAPPASTGPIIGAGGDNGGFVNNGSGYRYTGKIINTNQVNVRATASTSATVTTTLKSGASLVIYETTTAENMAWGRCDAGWVYLYYVDLTPCVDGAVDARVVANNVPGIIYSDSNCSDTVGTYSGMSVIDIYEIVGKMARTNLGWVSTDDLL